MTGVPNFDWPKIGRPGQLGVGAVVTHSQFLRQSSFKSFAPAATAPPGPPLPPGVFKPYAGVSTPILLLTKTNSSGTHTV